MLTQVRGEEVTIKYGARALLCQQIPGSMGFLEGKEIFLVASNQSCEKWILGRLSKNILGRRKKLCIEKQRKC